MKATDALKDVAVIKLTGMNTQSEELRLPAQTPQQTGKPCVTDSVAIWKQAGYRPSHAQQAFAELAHAFARIFPDNSIALPLIVGGGFPPINENGQVATGKQVQELNADLLNRLVRAAANSPSRASRTRVAARPRPSTTTRIWARPSRPRPAAWTTCRSRPRRQGGLSPSGPLHKRQKARNACDAFLAFCCKKDGGMLYRVLCCGLPA